MSEQVKYTPVPWMIWKESSIEIYPNNNDKIKTRIAVCRIEEDAEHIIKCVNSHDALLEAAKEMIEAMSGELSYTSLKPQKKKLEKAISEASK